MKYHFFFEIFLFDGFLITDKLSRLPSLRAK